MHRFICHGLLTGENYIFRVRAVNAAGLSDYSSNSEAIEVKAAIGKSLYDNYFPKRFSSLMFLFAFLLITIIIFLKESLLLLCSITNITISDSDSPSLIF